MAKQVIKVDGEDTMVREDTAKAYRGTYWALYCIGAFVIIALIVVFVFFIKKGTGDQPIQSPTKIEEKRR